MKIIFDNRYITSFRFESFREFSIFISNQKAKKVLALNEPYGDTYYCYNCYDSLTKEKLFIVSFCSDQNEKDLNLLVWKDRQLLVLDTGTNFYFIDEKLNIKASFEITSPLIGLHLTQGNNLLVLEEASLRLINSMGEILKSELFDLIEDFNLENGVLSVKIGDKIKSFELV